MPFEDGGLGRVGDGSTGQAGEVITELNAGSKSGATGKKGNENKTAATRTEHRSEQTATRRESRNDPATPEEESRSEGGGRIAQEEQNRSAAGEGQGEKKNPRGVIEKQIDELVRIGGRLDCTGLQERNRRRQILGADGAGLLD